jgi:phosphinothricin acetyltransferase
MSEIVIRRAVEPDLPALLDIYNHYVRNTHITFDVEPRTLDQRRLWFNHFNASGRLQCFVAARNSMAIGWASSHAFKDRAAYDTSVETSVYLAPGESGKGTGRVLYTALLQALTDQDVHRAFGGISLPNEASIALHLALGFTHVGTYHEVGRKFGRFWDVAWYQKAIT